MKELRDFESSYGGFFFFDFVEREGVKQEREMQKLWVISVLGCGCCVLFLPVSLKSVRSRVKSVRSCVGSVRSFASILQLL